MTLPDDELLARLRALPTQRQPPAEAWTRLAAQLPPRQPAAAVVTLPVQRQRLRWALPLGAALAASLVLYWVVPVQTPAPAPTALQLQARDLAGQYQQAMAALPPQRAAQWQPALLELDRSAEQINAALAESPGSRYLLEQLQRTYALRLELTRQAALAASPLTT